MWISVDEVELRMYTGLQDKYTRDIYEGDIVSGQVIEDYFSYNDVREVCTGIGTNLNLLPFSSNRTRKESYYQDIEIIGNKYENPELLQS